MEVGNILERVPVLTTEDDVVVIVKDETRVVADKIVAVVLMTVDLTVAVVRVVPLVVTVVLNTETCVTETVVGTGVEPVTVSVTTVSKVDTGNVNVCEMTGTEVVHVRLGKGGRALIGHRVEPGIHGILVGNGCTGGFPSV